MKSICLSLLFASTRRALAVLVLALALCSGARAQELGGPSADRDWQFIEKLQQDGMTDLAARQLVRFVQDHPEDARAADALLRAGEIYEDLGQQVAALGAYAQLIERYPASAAAPRSRLRTAELQMDAQAYQDAAETYRGLLTAHPASPEVDDARLGLAEALMALERDTEAGRLLRGLIGTRPAERIAARALYDLALLAQRAGADSLAITRFDEIHRRHPVDPVGALGLLRAGELLEGREAPKAAQARYLRVLDQYEEPFLRARAHLRLALILEEQNPKQAATHYRDVAEEGGTEEQVQLALLGLARSRLAAGDAGQARQAAEAFLTRFPDAEAVPRAQLFSAHADLLEGRDGARDQLLELGRSSDSSVAVEALSLLADRETRGGNPEQALELWRRVERAQPEPDGQAGALLAQCRLAGPALGRWALGADAARQAHALAVDEQLQAEALLEAMIATAAIGHQEEAIALGEQLLREHPLSPPASEARTQLSLLRRRAAGDPATAARQLAELVGSDAGDPSERALRAGRILRDVMGDLGAAESSFEQARARAQDPVALAWADLESARGMQMLALEAGLAGETEQARRQLARARSRFADAAARAGGEPASAKARIDLLGLDLAAAARPETPWLFDSRRAPLLGAVGVAEGVDLSSETLQEARERIEATLEKTDEGVDRAWLLWRWAELAVEVDREDRLAATGRGLELDPPEELELGLRLCRGQLLMEEAEGAQAARELSRVIDAAPGSEAAMSARYALAEVQREARRYAQAQELYAEFANAYPRSQRGQRSLLLAGDCALFGGDAEAAVERYRELLGRYPGSVYEDDALYRLGTALQRIGRLEAAREPLLRLVDGPSSDYRGRALARLGQVELAAGRDSVAVEVYQRLVEEDPERAREEQASLQIARILVDVGRPADALGPLDRFDAGGEPEAKSLALRVRALAGAGRLREAGGRLDQLSRAFPDQPELIAEARIDYAERLSEAGEHDDAREQFEIAATESRSPATRARAAHGEGLTLMRAGEFEAALERLEAAVRVAPESEWAAEALYKIGGITARTGRSERAQKAFARLAAEHPRHRLRPDALRAEASVWRDLGRYDEALKIYHRVLEEYPESPGGEDVLNDIAYCHYEMGQYEIALAAYQRVMPYLKAEEQAYAQFWIADSLSQLGRHEEAAAEFLRLPYLYPQAGDLPVTAQLKAGESYERMGQFDAASRLYEKVLNSHGSDSQWGAEARKRLDRIARADRGEG